jgi:hypothetical protein
MKKHLLPELVNVEFECPRCQRNTDICSVVEIASSGCPMCVDCQEEMEIIDCYTEECHEDEN